MRAPPQRPSPLPSGHRLLTMLMRAFPVAHIQVGVLMKIYLVTVADQDAIYRIDMAIEEDRPLFIGDSNKPGPIAEIQEYVNVDSP
jgi:hypothetical protein